MKLNRIFVLFVLFVLLAACNASEPEVETAIPQTATSKPTITVTPASTKTETQSPDGDKAQAMSASDTATLQATVTPTNEETPIPSATDMVVYITSNDVLALRTGPGTYYRILELLPKGTKVIVLGTEPARRWFLVQKLDGTEEEENEGWMFGEYLSIDRNNLGLIPVVDATPTPEPIQETPDLTATQECKWLENKGTPCP